MAEKSKKKSAEGGGNPKDAGVGVTGLEHLFPGLSEGLFGGPSFSNFNIGGYGGGQGAMAPGAEGGGDQRKKLEAMVQMWREQLAAKQAAQIRPAEVFEARERAI